MPSLGHEVVAWMQRFLIHGPGDVQGEPIRLDQEFYDFVVDCYEIDSSGSREGRRRRRRAFLSRAKGRAKSELAGMLVCAESLGPVRFSHWASEGEVNEWGYRFEPGDPVGQPVTYPFIRCLATEEGQSGNTFANVAFMLHPDTASELLVEAYPGIDAGRDWQTSTRVYLPGGGEVRPSTASSAAKDGGKESFAVADETHLYVLPELRAMHSTVIRNLAKRKTAEPWMLETSTMYAPGQDSIAEQTHEAYQNRPDAGLLFDHKQASVGLDECSTVEQVVAAVTEAYGDFADNMDLTPLAEDILAGLVEDPERYFFNRPTHRSDDWADVDKWKARKRKGGLVPPDGLRIVLGFDGSQGTSDSRVADSTALRGKVLEQGPWFGHVFTVGIWEADGDRSWVAPFDEVDVAVDEAFSRWDVWRMYADPPYWRDFIRNWQSRHGEDRVIEWWTNRDRQMAHALEALHVAVHSEESDLTHDGDERAQAHYANVRRHVKKARLAQDDPDGKKELVLVRKETPRSALKIDVVVVDALAHEAFGDGVAAGKHKRRKKQKTYGF